MAVIAAAAPVAVSLPLLPDVSGSRVLASASGAPAVGAVGYSAASSALSGAACVSPAACLLGAFSAGAFAVLAVDSRSVELSAVFVLFASAVPSIWSVAVAAVHLRT